MGSGCYAPPLDNTRLRHGHVYTTRESRRAIRTETNPERTVRTLLVYITCRYIRSRSFTWHANNAAAFVVLLCFVLSLSKQIGHVAIARTIPTLHYSTLLLHSSSSSSSSSPRTPLERYKLCVWLGPASRKLRIVRINSSLPLDPENTAGGGRYSVRVYQIFISSQ